MFRLFFLSASMLYIGLMSLFVETSHTVVEDRHIFVYNRLATFLGIGFNTIPLLAAWYLLRVKKDRTGAGIMLMVIPLFIFLILPQYFLERVEVSATQLKHRREPPHTRFNADIAFTDVLSGIELHYQNGKRGYRLFLKNGRTLELPANTVLTAAADTVTAQLQAHHIPMTKEVVRQEEN